MSAVIKHSEERLMKVLLAPVKKSTIRRATEGP